MDVFSLLIGGIAVVLGIATLFARRRQNPNTLKKLTAMRERYGEKTGSMIHLIAYTVLPIVLGLMIIAFSLLRGY